MEPGMIEIKGWIVYVIFVLNIPPLWHYVFTNRSIPVPPFSYPSPNKPSQPPIVSLSLIKGVQLRVMGWLGNLFIFWLIIPSICWFCTPYAWLSYPGLKVDPRSIQLTTKKDKCEQPPMIDLVVIFFIFNHLTKLLLCLHYCISSDCSLTISVKILDPKFYFTIKNIPFEGTLASQVCCFYFYFLHSRGGGNCEQIIQSWGTGRMMIYFDKTIGGIVV